MNNRQDDITSFLKYAYKVKNGKQKDFSEKDVYLLLLSYDIDQNDFGKSYSNSYFDYWIEFYKNNKNIKICDSLNDDDYLRFDNINNIDDNNFIKLFINVSKDRYFNAVTKLIEYLTINVDIEHISKISKIVRSDQISIEVRNLRNALKLINYIHSNQNVFSGLKNANPFVLRYGNVGLSFDNIVGYNMAMSFVIYLYLINVKDIGEICAANFVSFVTEFCNNVIDHNSFDVYADFINNTYVINNYNSVKNVIPNLDINTIVSEYLVIYENFIKIYYSGDDLTYFAKYYEEFKNRKINIDIYNICKRKHKLYASKNILNEYIKYAYIKYNSNKDAIYNALSNFVICLNSQKRDFDKAIMYITKDKGFRKAFVDITSEDILLITKNNIYSYIENLLNSNY